MNDDLFVPHPPAGDASNRIPTTGWVGTAIASGSIGTSFAGLSVIGNASTVTAAPLAIAASAGDQFPFTNSAFTTIVWGTISTFLDNAVGSTNGAVLARNAATWVATTSVGGKVLLNTLLPNGVASVVDTTSISGTYRVYEIEFESVVPALSTAFLQVRIATSGTNFQTTNYSAVSVANGVAASINSAMLMQGGSMTTVAGFGYTGYMRVDNPLGATAFKIFNGFGGYFSSAGTAISVTNSGAWFGTTSPITGFAIMMAAGNISTGTIRVYGMN